MTMLVIEGMEGYGTSGAATTLPTKHTGSTTSIDIVAGEHGGFALEFIATADNLFIGIPNTTEIVFGFNFKMAVIGFERLIFTREGGTNNVGIVVNADGSLRIERTATTLSTSATGVVTNDIWHYIELKVKIDNSTGSYDLTVDGVSVTSGSGVDTQNSTNAWTDEILFRGRATTTVQIDDFYILDTASGTHNDFLGAQVVISGFPDGDDTANFTRSAGSSNYLLVDDDPHDTDTTYVESGTSTTKDLYDYATIGTLTDIKCVQVSTFVRETDGSDFTLITPVKSNTTESDDSSQAIAGTTFESLTRLLELDPDTSAAWTDTNIDAAKFGIKVG